MYQELRARTVAQALAQERQELTGSIALWEKMLGSRAAGALSAADREALLDVLLHLTSATVGTHLRPADAAQMLQQAQALQFNDLRASGDTWRQAALTQLWPTSLRLPTQLPDGLRPHRLLVGVVQQADAEVRLADLELLLEALAVQCGLTDTGSIEFGWGGSDEPGTDVRVLLVAALQAS